MPSLVAKCCEPAFPERNSISSRPRRRSARQAEDRPDRSGFADNIAAAPYPKGHALHTPTFDEEIALLKAATIDDIKSLYAEQISAAAGEVAVLGDFDSDATLKQLRAMLGGWTAKTPHRRIPRPAFADLPGGKTDINTPDKANAMYVAVMSFPVGETHPDAIALDVGNYMFGGASLSSRLAGRVRGKEGLSYGCNTVYTPSPRRRLALTSCTPSPTRRISTKVSDIIDEEMTKYPAKVRR